MDKVITASGIAGDDDGAFLVTGDDILNVAIKSLSEDLRIACEYGGRSTTRVNVTDLAVVLQAIKRMRQ